MLDQIGSNYQTSNTANNSPVTETKRVLTMVKNERMGGMVPKWETITVTKAQDIEQTLASAATTTAPEDSFKSALAYQNSQETPAKDAPEEFGFGDIVDMVNPLHHIPVVGHIYRNITGDEIKPIGKIIGGAIFGGPAGAASNLINTIIEEETGKDLTENAFALAFKGKAPSFKTASLDQTHPEKTLNNAVRTMHKTPHEEDLPASLLAFTDNSKEGIHIEKRPTARGRTAGYMSHRTYPQINAEMLLMRDPITEVILRRMPNKY